MTGSKKSAFFFLIAGIMLIGQAIVSAGLLGDSLGAIVAGTLACLMFVGMIAAWKGSLATVLKYERRPGAFGTETVAKDIGERVQATPCCGICVGALAIAIAFIAGSPLFDIYGDLGGFMLISPGVIGGVFGIIAGIVFAIEYKGIWHKEGSDDLSY